ncbi:hypothetical protein Tco_0344457 [Tanacetum coccineum]
MCYKMSRLVGTYYLKETGEKVDDEELGERYDRQNFPEHGHLSIGPIRNEDGGSIQELSDKRLYKTYSAQWGAPVLLSKKKDGSLRLCMIIGNYTK